MTTKKYWGIGIIITSFLLFGVVFLVPFLPLSTAMKATTAATFWGMSEITLVIGGLLVGKQVISKYKADIIQWLKFWEAKSYEVEVLVFKTDVISQIQVTSVALALQKLNGIAHWNFDLDDCDKILRVEVKKGTKRVSYQIVDTLRNMNFRCEELQ